jgi:hypothetical protein
LKKKIALLQMRKLFGLLCLFILLSAFNCDNEPVDFEINLSTVNTQLLGEWNLLEFSTEVISSTDNSTDSNLSEIRLFSSTTDYAINFSEDGFSTNGSYTYNFAVAIDEEIITNDNNAIENIELSNTYFVSNNSISLEDSFFELQVPGTELLVLAGEQTYSFTISDDGEYLIFFQNQTIIDRDPFSGVEAVINKRSSSVWTKDLSIISCDLRDATNQAAAAYNLSDEDIQLCIAYRMALENQISTCGDPEGRLQEIVDELGVCGLLSGDLLRVTAGPLDLDFPNKTITLNNGIITTEGISLDGNSNIFFQVQENQTGIDNFQNFRLTIDGTDYFPSYPGVNNFRSNTLISSNYSFNAIFEGTVASTAGVEILLSTGVVDVNY